VSRVEAAEDQKELPPSSEFQTKLSVVEKPNGTLVKIVPFGATCTSGSFPGGRVTGRSWLV